jgi:type VII secretion protein EccE
VHHRRGSQDTKSPVAQKGKELTTPVVSPQLSKTSAIAVQRVLPLADLLLVQTFVATGIVVGLLGGEPGWYGAAAGLGVGLLAVVRIRRMSIPRWAAAWLGWWYRRRRGHKGERFEPFNAELPDGSQIGLYWDGKILMSLMRILEDPQGTTVMEPALTVSGQTVSAQTLADCLQQFDVELDSIDVISHGARSHSRSQLGSVYEAVVGPLPAIARRSVWVVVRLNPSLCTDAVRHRGGGWHGVVRTAATVTRRVANRLSDVGLRTQILTADEISQATSELLHDADLSTLDESWRACRDGRYELRSYGFEPSMFTTAGLGLLWTVPSDWTTVCLSMRRDQRNDVIKLRGLVRFDGYGNTKVTLGGLSHLPGRQYAALVSALPCPSPRRPLAGWVVGRDSNSIGDLEIPVSGCGQVIGADQHGRAVALPLFGSQVQRVELCGTLYLAQQVVLRSLALGAWVRVHSRRPLAWRGMVEQVGDDSLLVVNGQTAGAPNAPAGRNYSVEMFDGMPEETVQHGVTTMVVKPAHVEPAPDADVSLELIDHQRDLVRVGTRAATATVTMVATPDEMRYIKSSLDAVE